MFKYAFPNFLSIVCITSLLISGCSFCAGDLCSEIECGENGECIEGDCVCETGYVGLACDNIANERFAGVYSAHEVCEDSLNPFSNPIMIQAKGGSKIELLFAGLYNLPSNKVTATIQWDGVSFEIPKQSLNAQLKIEGSGIHASTGKQINLNYMILDATSEVDHCQVVLNR